VVKSNTLSAALLPGGSALSWSLTSAATTVRVQTSPAPKSVVTGVRSNGYYIQDPSPDANDATSEGILVFTSICR